VWNRTRSRAEAWVREHGGQVADTPRAVAERADVVITMVVDGPQVEQVLLGEEGAAHGARDGALFVDMSTIAPADSRRIGAALAERGIAFVDAPVTGSAPRAEAGTLTIMTGGEAAHVERARPLFEVMGETVLHVGALGQGEMIKLINNAVAAIHCTALAQALVVGRATGVDLEALVAVMRAGAGRSAMLDVKAAPMLARDFEPLFKLEHMLKDVRLCLEEGQRAGVPFPAAAEVRELLIAGVGRGLGEQDFAAVLEVVEGLAGKRL
jgi:3-hydroxyisobutyrate dehydrogenase-like beta-hydroxyacid dehydrogenase